MMSCDRRDSGQQHSALLDPVRRAIRLADTIPDEAQAAAALPLLVQHIRSQPAAADLRLLQLASESLAAAQPFTLAAASGFPALQQHPFGPQPFSSNPFPSQPLHNQPFPSQPFADPGHHPFATPQLSQETCFRCGRLGHRGNQCNQQVGVDGAILAKGQAAKFAPVSYKTNFNYDSNGFSIRPPRPLK